MSARASLVPTWDARELLQIDNPDTGYFTCVGYAPSQRRRCRNTIAAHNRSAVEKVLQKLPRIAARSPNILDDELFDLAELALCRRYHQSQAEGIAERWKQRIQIEVARTRVQRPQPSSRNHVSVRTSPISAVVERPSRTQTTSSTHSHSETSTESTSSLDTLDGIRQLLNEIDSRLRHLENNSRVGEPARPNIQPMASQPENQSDGDDNDDDDSEDREANETSAPSSPITSRASSEDNECGICLEQLNCPARTPCGHTYCRECIERWLEDPDRQNCPFDRRVLRLEDLRDASTSSEDNVCGICLEQLSCPTRTPCSHTFCQACIETWLRDGARQICPYDRQPLRLEDLVKVSE